MIVHSDCLSINLLLLQTKVGHANSIKFFRIYCLNSKIFLMRMISRYAHKSIDCSPNIAFFYSQKHDEQKIPKDKYINKMRRTSTFDTPFLKHE